MRTEFRDFGQKTSSEVTTTEIWVYMGGGGG